jgi:DNA-binding beta-propeller fold protein YncE
VSFFEQVTQPPTLPHTSLGSGLVMPTDVVVSPDGLTLYVADFGNGSIVRMSSLGKDQRTIATGMNGPNFLAIGVGGRYLYVANTKGGTIARVPPTGGAWTSVRTDQPLSQPTGITVGPGGRDLYVTSANFVYQIAGNGVTRTFATGTFNGFSPEALATTPNGDDIVVADWGVSGQIYEMSTRLCCSVSTQHPYVVGRTPRGLRLIANLGTFFPDSVVVSPNGKSLYFTQSLTTSIGVVDLATGNTSYFNAGLSGPAGMSFSPNGMYLYVADGSNIVKIDVS